MDFYLPIAEVYVSLPFIFFLSFVVGILSGLFGVGGGFLMTPFLIFLGIPPAYAVPNEANNILGTSISGSTTHYLKGTLDYKMGFMIVIGGAAGTILGIITFTYFKDIGKINIVISLAYMYILAIIGTLMLVQGVTEIDRARRKVVVRKKLHSHYWIHGLPLRMRFKKSKLYESVFTPILIGLIVGFIAAIMGIGGAFILVPAMIYKIGMPTKLIPGTSLFVTIFVSAIVTVLHAFNYGTIDLVLLLVGIAIAYDTFFVEDAINQAARSAQENLNWLSQFVKDFQKDQPISYGLASIVLALGLGVGAAMVRHFFSRIKKKAEQS